MTSFRYLLSLWTAGWLFAAASLHAQQPPAPAKAPDPATVGALRETIAQWVETERLVSAETSGWAERKESMARLLELYKQELGLLNEELEKAGQSAESFDEKKTKLESESAALRSARAELANAVGKGRVTLIELSKQFPQPLMDDVDPDLSQLKEWKSADEVRPALQALLRVVEKATKFATHVTRSREIRENRELEVIYLGLACAYYKSADGTAGIAHIEKGAWVWQNRPDLHKKIAQVFLQLDEQREPALIRLPAPARSEEAAAK